MNKKNYFLNERVRCQYNDGDYVKVGDKVKYQGKMCTVLGVNRDGTVNLKFEDGLGNDNVEIRNLQKIASHFSKIQMEFIKSLI